MCLWVELQDVSVLDKRYKSLIQTPLFTHLASFISFERSSLKQRGLLLSILFGQVIDSTYTSCQIKATLSIACGKRHYTPRDANGKRPADKPNMLTDSERGDLVKFWTEEQQVLSDRNIKSRSHQKPKHTMA
ncbi:hypothetical protein MKW98_005835 [Papaver atlanticum]|uniref:Uncharacterized protein n=1 Tax=Papaver atlanticum TaxID=357466 RepID=A0AAD4TDX1_9MAGN|nr:hypothetical protein MKW98_005835 [Papaver atlanticum]